MVNEGGILIFSEWIASAPLTWLAVMGALLLSAGVVGWLALAMRRGPGAAFAGMGGVISGSLSDVVRLSPRRVAALSWLAVKESIRRRVVVVFAIFIVVLLFAGWFLDPTSSEPARLYLTFVLTATSYLVLLLGLFLSSMSLPNDIRHKTLYTVVTKPVRPSEIVLGRIVGFTVIGTCLLAVMGILSYGFVVRGLSHGHRISEADIERAQRAASEGRNDPLDLVTDENQGHRHVVRITMDGGSEPRSELFEPQNGHWHELTYSFEPMDGGSGADKRLVYQIGPPQGALAARVPVYGKLQFLDRVGIDTAKGINVGDEWTYRSYVQGGTQAAGVWSFTGLREQDFPDGLPVEMNIGIFRTHKGTIEHGVLGSIAVRNPKTGLRVEVEVFEAKEFTVKRLTIPRKIVSFASKQVVQRKRITPEKQTLVDPKNPDMGLESKKEFDLFQDLVADGQTEIWLKCLEPAQYFGFAQPDLYLRAADASFALNFAKGYLGVWLQMVLVISFGVMFSTFLSGPVAMLATLGTLLAGLCSEFMLQLGRGETYGGGPFESVIRLLYQQNVTSELDPSLGGSAAQMIDKVIEVMLVAAAHLLPAFGDFSFSDHVAYGYDISVTLISVRVLTAAAFLIPLFIIGQTFLKTREIAQ